MMIVITMSCCPSKLRGDLTRWFVEIDTGVYVGNLTARVRDAVWDRICKNIGTGRATMVYSANNEQKLNFLIHNSTWEPVDYDGITLVRRNVSSQDEETYKQRSNIVVRHRMHQGQKAISNNSERLHDCYAVIDLETTGLQDDDQIIEIGAIIVENGSVNRSFSRLVRSEKKIPVAVCEMTGISNNMLEAEGVSLSEAIPQFLSFIGSLEIVGFSVGFDLKFLQKACEDLGLSAIESKQTDVQKDARKKLKTCSKYNLSSVAEALGIEVKQRHRALVDCELTYRIFEKLKEF